MSDFLGSDSAYAREIAAYTPDPAPLHTELRDDFSRNINEVLPVGAERTATDSDIRTARNPAMQIRPALRNLAMSINERDGRVYDAFHSGARVDLIPYIIPDSDLVGGMESDNVKRNTAALEFRAWDTDLVWGIEEMHPDLVDENGIIR